MSFIYFLVNVYMYTVTKEEVMVELGQIFVVLTWALFRETAWQKKLSAFTC